MLLCGICKTLYPEISEWIDETCVECKMHGDCVCADDKGGGCV